GVAEREQNQRLTALLKALDRDDGIFTTADRNQSVVRKIKGDRRRSRRAAGPKMKMAPQGKAISICKFGEALFVEFMQKFAGLCVDLECTESKQLWYDRLVITPPTQQKKQAIDPVEPLLPI